MARKKRIKRRQNRSLALDIVLNLILLLFACFMALPFVYAICQAFKPMEELFVFPPTFFVRNPTLENFSDLFLLMGQSWVPFSRYILNSLLVTGLGTYLHIVAASLAAYTLEKHRFPGRDFFFSVVVLSLMFSSQVTSIPNYIIMSKLGWIDSYLALVVPAVAMPMGLYLMKQFMNQVPDNIIESARIDGCGEFMIFMRIVMPMVKPAWLTLIIFAIQSLWNAPSGSFIYSEELKTLPNALSQIASTGISRAGVGAAVAVLVMLLPLTVFIVNQSNVMQTMATSGMKE